MTATTELFLALAERIGWMLLHSLWIGALAAAALGLVLRLLRRRRAAERHTVCLATLVAMGIGAIAAGSMAGNHSPAAPAETAAAATAPSNVAGRPEGDRQPATGSSLATESISPVRDPATAATSRAFSVAAIVPWLTAGWLVGFAVLVLRHLWGWRELEAIRRRGKPARPMVVGTVERVASVFGIHPSIKVLESVEAVGPMLIGLVRPVILLPVRTITGLGSGEIEAIVTHELAHLARRDAWSNIALLVLETVFFYHPAVWWIARRTRQERENAADDLALEVFRDRRRYAAALARLAEMHVLQNAALAASGGSLAARVRRILEPVPSEVPGGHWGGPLATCLGALAFAAVLHAQVDPRPATETGADAEAVPAAEVPAAGSGESPRPDPIDAEQIVADAFQLDDAGRRDAAIARLREAMADGSPDEARTAVTAFARLGPIEFDKASFRPAVRRLLESGDPTTRAAAAGAFTLTGTAPEDLAKIVALADDPSPHVRDGLARVIMQVTGGDLTGKPASDAILKLMEELPKDPRSVAHSIWGGRFSPEIEARVLRFCEDISGFGTGYTFFYGALSTQANKGEASVRRLIEILADQDTTNKAGRAAWGLQQGVAPAEYALVADAMVKVVQARSDGYLRKNALACLGKYGGRSHAEALRAILAKPNVDGEFRSALENTLAAIDRRSAAR